MFKLWIHWLVMVHIDLYTEKYNLNVPGPGEICWQRESEIGNIVTYLWETVDPHFKA